MLTQCMRMHILAASRTDSGDRLGGHMEQATTPATRFDSRLWGLLLLLCGVLFLDGMDVSMVAVALPNIGHELDLQPSSLQWIVSGYVLGYGGLLLLGGRAADLIGRRKVLLGGLLTELGWRSTFFMPVPIAAAILFLLPRYLDRDEGAGFSHRKLDFAGTATLAATMLGLVYTVVEAPDVGWGSARTLLSFVGVGALLSAFVLIEQHSPNPLVRLGILRSGQLRRANFGAMALLGSWFGFQFMGTLYMQDLRDWSAVQMALAFLPA